MSAILLAFAFAVAPMTATRNEAAFGPTDIILAIASVVSVVRAALVRARSAGTPAAADAVFRGGDAALPVVWVWFAMLGIMLISTLLDWPMVTAFDPQPMLTFLTYTVSAALMFALYVEGAGGRLRTFLVASIVIAFVIEVIYLAGYLAGFEPFFFYFRFVGLSENPNQTALHMLSFLVLAVMTLAKVPDLSRTIRALGMAVVLLALAIGLLSDSDAFTIASAVTVVGLGAYLLVAVFRSRSMWAGAIIFFGLPALGCLAVIYSDEVHGVYSAIQNELEYGNQDLDRISLWVHGIDAWLRRPWLGNGIGAWSGISTPFEAREAHNTFIDWLTVAGIVGLLAYLAFLASQFRRPIQRYVASYFALLSVLTFSMFHYTFRQPSFWLCFVAIQLVSGFVDAQGRDEERLSGKRGEGFRLPLLGERRLGASAQPTAKI